MSRKSKLGSTNRKHTSLRKYKSGNVIGEIQIEQIHVGNTYLKNTSQKYISEIGNRKTRIRKKRGMITNPKGTTHKIQIKTIQIGNYTTGNINRTIQTGQYKS